MQQIIKQEEQNASFTVILAHVNLQIITTNISEMNLVQLSFVAILILFLLF